MLSGNIFAYSVLVLFVSTLNCFRYTSICIVITFYFLCLFFIFLFIFLIRVEYNTEVVQKRYITKKLYEEEIAEAINTMLVGHHVAILT